MAIRFGPKIRKKREKDASSEGQSRVAEQQGGTKEDYWKT
jgi:hypothetical protein